MLMAKANGINNISVVKAKGACYCKSVTFAAPVFVSLTGASEPAVSGAVQITKPFDSILYSQ